MGQHKIDQELIKTIRILRANGLSYDKISHRLSLGKGTVYKYAHDVEILPEKMRRDPWEAYNEAYKIKTKLDRDEFKTAHEEKVYWVQQHEEGKPYQGPLDVISLDELSETMREPTDYHSPLIFPEWWNFFFAPYLGENIKMNLSQIMMNHFLENHKYALIKIFRDAGKTVLFEGKMLYLCGENRNYSYFIQSESVHISTNRLLVVSSHIKSNKRFIAYYGYLAHDD